MIESSTSTQQVVSLSTAESEFYGIVRGAASGIQLREAFTQLGFTVQLRVLSDSSAARAMTARTGSGRVKHVEARYLWVQDRVRKKQFSVGCIDTSHNKADLGTKFSQRRALAGTGADDAYCGWRVRADEDTKEIAWIVVLGVTGDAGAGQ